MSRSCDCPMSWSEGHCSGVHRVMVYEPQARCAHAEQFTNGDVVICESCGERGTIVRGVAELIQWGVDSGAPRQGPLPTEVPGSDGAAHDRTPTSGGES